MKKTSSHTHVAISSHLQSAQWYQATTLAERLPFLQASQARDDVHAVSDKAAHRLRQWKSQFPFNKSTGSFTRRLAQDGLTEGSLLNLLGQPAELLQDAFDTPPAWLAEFIAAFSEQDSVALSSLQQIHLHDPQADATFRSLKPLLATGYARLQAGIAKLQERYTDFPFDPRTIDFLLLPQFLNKTFMRLSRTLVLEVNVARVQGRLQGETPEERFLYFLEQLAQKDTTLTFLEEYPVLARHLVETIERQISSTLELLQRLTADWNEIRTIFMPAGETGVLTEIRENAGDFHDNGRSVTILTWSSGFQLVYKPRPLAIDTHFQELLAWLNEQGCQFAFRTLQVLDKGPYGWCEFVSVTNCTSPEEVQRFYQRLGGYLALLYTLEATDFHAENLLAVGEHPMLIDLESLFQPHAGTSAGISTYIQTLISHSVLRPGLLPERLWANAEAPGVDLTGFGGQESQLSPFAVPTLKGQGTDEIYIGRERAEIKLGANQPKLQGQTIHLLAQEQHIITGFTDIYRILLRQREQLLPMIANFAHDEIRILLRATTDYSLILEESFHPNVLRDALDRERLFDRLWIGVENTPHLAQVIAAERAGLWREDIPKFTTRPDMCDLFTSYGEPVPNFFQESGMDLVKRCIQQLSEQDLERQVWVIQASFASLTLNNGTTQPSRLNLEPAPKLAGSAEFLAEAQAIGDRLDRLTLSQSDAIGWLSVGLINHQEWMPQLTGLDLYGGLPGITFFLAYLGHLSNNKRYTEIARKVLAMLDTLVLTKMSTWQWHSLSAFEGAGTLIYLLAHLGTLWQDPSLYRQAEEVVAHIPGLISGDEYFDLMDGAAGCIAALLSLYEVAPSETTLKAAVQCGEHLLKFAQPMPSGIGWCAKNMKLPLAGLAHGNAGIALNLLRLAAVSHDERFHQSALAAMEYERSLFSPIKGNWPDLREATSDDLQAAASLDSYMVAWCHGAAGIGQARLEGLSFHDDQAIRMEIDVAIQTLLREGFGRNHCLCHGDMGNLDTLLTASQVLPDVYARGNIAPLEASLLASMHAQGWQSGIPLEIETPGLMLGLAGTGYTLLRLAAPEQVPSVLTLAPPKHA